MSRLPLPEPCAYYWSPTPESGLSPSLACWSANTGPHPDWCVTRYYTASQMHAYADASNAALTEQVRVLRDALESALQGFTAANPYLPGHCPAEFVFYAAWDDVNKALEAAK